MSSCVAFTPPRATASFAPVLRTCRSPLLCLSITSLLLVLIAAAAPAASAAVSFSGPTNFAVGDAPRLVAVADFDGDSDPDLAVANQNSDNVSVLLGGADESFGAASNFAVGDAPFGVAVSDFNGDSDPDLAAANFFSDNVSVLLGGAGGSFGAATNFAVGDGPGGVAVGDFNGDSDPDLAVANRNSDNVSVLLGGAGGSFGAATNFAVGDGPQSVAVGDFDGDSDPDLAVANINSGNVSVLLGAAGGSFGAATNFATGGTAPNGIAVGDFNGDSEPDLAVTNLNSDNVSVLLNTTNAPTVSLTPATATNTAGEQHCVTATVADSFGNPTPNITVRYSVSGANSASGSDTTNSSGEASFCYTGTTAGADTIQAFADIDGGGTRNGTEPGDAASKTYTAADPASLILSPASATNTVDDQHCVTATVTDSFGNPVPNVSVVFRVSGANTAGATQNTDASGQAQFCYQGVLAGSDSIFAVDADGFAASFAEKTWLAPASTPCTVKVNNKSSMVAENGDPATFSGTVKQTSASGTSGGEDYLDQGPADPLLVSSTSISAVVCSGTSASIFGTATVNGLGSHAFRIDVQDLGEPGRLADTYRIRLDTGYDSGPQQLRKGNVQIH